MIYSDLYYHIAANALVVAVAGFRELHYPLNQNPHAIINIIKMRDFNEIFNPFAHYPAIATTLCYGYVIF